MNAPFRPPSRGLIAGRLIGGFAWLALLAWLASMATETDFLPVLAITCGGALASGAIALAWLTLWAQRENSLAGQFTIGSLLFATCLAAIFFAAVRWLGSNLAFLPERASPSGSTYFGVAVAGLLALAISIPIVFGMLDSLLRIAIWLLRRPAMRTAVRAMLRSARRIAGRGSSGTPR